MRGLLEWVRSRIAAKLTLTLLGFVAVVIIVASIYLDRRLESIAIGDLITQLTRESRLIEPTVHPVFNRSAPSAATQQLLTSLSAVTSARVTLITREGLVLGDSDRTVEGVIQMDNHRERPEVSAALVTGVGASRRHSDTTGVETLYVAMRTSDGRGIVRLGYPLDEVARTTGEIRKAVIVGGVFAMAVALGISLFVSRRLTRPVVEMERVAHRMARGDFSAKVPLHSVDEIGRLGRALNTMTESLKTRIQELEEERAKVAAILESMVEGVIAVDADDRVVLLNPSAAEIVRTRRQSAVGRPFLEALRNKDLYDLIGESRAAGAGKVIRREFHLFTPVDRVLQAHAVTFTLQDERPGVFLVLHDITELRHLEQVRTEFVANVSHELRTPLTAIRGYLETLLGGALDEPEQSRRFLEITFRHSERLGRLLDDLLDLSNIELGKAGLKLEPIELGDVLDAVLTIMRPQADVKGIALSAEITAGLPRVVADRDRLIQILINLVDNAVKFTTREGRVTVTAGIQGNAACLAVSDTGVGIPSTDLPRITERFYTVDKARSRELGGTGLGLAIVKHLVQAHGGELTIESILGRGTTVRFTLPVAAS